MEDGDIRGIFILDAADRAGAEAMCNNDPAAQAGQLVYDIGPWLSQKGETLKQGGSPKIMGGVNLFSLPAWLPDVYSK